MREVFACEPELATMLDCLRSRTTDAVAADVAETYLAGAEHPGCSTKAETIVVGVPVFRGQ
jgi:hypothetical protein